jgi:hypothetical protein
MAAPTAVSTPLARRTLLCLAPVETTAPRAWGKDYATNFLEFVQRVPRNAPRVF